MKAIAEGKNIRHSRGGTFGEYAPIDWSKNKIKRADGSDYDVIYSGSNGAGFTIFDPSYADDGISNFATDSMLVAQSYTRGGENTGEFNPFDADDNRKQNYACRTDGKAYTLLLAAGRY